MKILFIGDVVGKIGRKALAKALPEIKQSIQPDVVIANVENAAHGTGITIKTFEEIAAAGVDAFTLGNHALKKAEGAELLADESKKIIRPANFPPQTPGKGAIVIEIGGYKILLINMMGQAFMNQEVSEPFQTFDELLSQYRGESLSAIIVDFHAEATSEKAAFGHYVDGKVTAVVGTHTHVPTADTKLLTNGTAFVTDIGMVGATDSVIGVDKQSALSVFLEKAAQRFTIPETGATQINAVIITIDEKTAKATAIERLDRIVEV